MFVCIFINTHHCVVVSNYLFLRVCRTRTKGTHTRGTHTRTRSTSSRRRRSSSNIILKQSRGTGSPTTSRWGRLLRRGGVLSLGGLLRRGGHLVAAAARHTRGEWPNLSRRYPRMEMIRDSMDRDRVAHCTPLACCVCVYFLAGAHIWLMRVHFVELVYLYQRARIYIYTCRVRARTQNDCCYVWQRFGL